MISIHSNFAWSALAATIMSLQCQLAAMQCGRARKEFKIDYPDMGCGRNAAKLTDEQWQQFNSVIRIHYNYVEQLPVILSNVLISGLFFPTFSPVVGFLYIIGRQLFSSGYKSKGPKGRLVGAVLIHLSMFTLMGSSFYGIYKTLMS
ncbi:hypothetical protein BB561_005347 [Smittium simulii]|uniref:MAPEG family protein n=1 Tax=Smittium simulii TaxID=133385 RepID=A0A2T9YAU0_9FUNG|nr:hypothetical protein BB561_005347 [Smittium simulii]